MLWRTSFCIYLCMLAISDIAAADSTGFKWGNNACEHLIDYPLWFTSPYCTQNPNVLSRMPDIITRSGYTSEEHIVVTEDKYLLSLFHLKSASENAPVVFLQHGYGSNAHVWVDKFNKSLAFHLNDMGFDVWIGNIRGSLYSGHEMLSMDSQTFWDINLDVVSQRDLPAMLDYVAEHCGEGAPIIYIGHAVGTTVSYMYAAAAPAAQRRLRGIISLSPLGCPENVTLIRFLAPLYPFLKGLLDLIGVKVILYPESMLHLFLVNFCRLFPYVCMTMLQLYGGRDSGQIAPKDLLLLVSGAPSPYPTDIWLHYLQMSTSKHLAMFDYGSIENQRRYQTTRPPAYDLASIKIPVYLLHGRNDLLAPPQDVQNLLAALGSEEKIMIQISPDGKVDYNHVDFKYGKNVDTQLYPVIDKAIKNILEGGESGQSGNGGSGGGNSQSNGSLHQGKPGNSGEDVRGSVTGTSSDASLNSLIDDVFGTNPGGAKAQAGFHLQDPTGDPNSNGGGKTGVNSGEAFIFPDF